MQFPQFSVAFGLLMMAVCCSGHIGGRIAYQDIDPQKYCGRALARVIATICDDSPTGKRSDAGTMYGLILSPYYKEEDSFGWPLMEPHKAKSFGLPSRGKRFIVDECCLKSCSVSELMSYC